MRFATVLLIIGAVLSGCVSSRAVEAPAISLSPAGWQNNPELLASDNFAGYAQLVTDEVRRYRIPFDPERADIEVAMASPIEIPPAAHCAGRASGIAILLHGLADTAFSLRDMGTVLASACYKSRVVLLPGHGTRSGDLLTTRLAHWQQTLDYLIDQAIAETETVILTGFSLGGVLTLDVALRRPNDIDGIIALSPAYYLSSAKIARWAPWVAPVMRWVDRGIADDPMRYEAMPTRGIGETWRAMQRLHRTLDKHGPLTVPWLLAQSMDDAVVVPDQNEALWKSQAENPQSRLIRFVSDQQYPAEPNVLNLPGYSEKDRVIALTHLAIHQSPDNSHYGKNGHYRNCGSSMPRDVEKVARCEQSKSVWYGLWKTEAGADQPLAFSTFNPSFDRFAVEVEKFASVIAGTTPRSQ